MKTAAAWNVKGVGIDARETAREAARRAGLSVGEWLNSVIIDSADGGQDGHLTDQEAENFSAIRQQLDALTARVGTMAAPPSRERPRPMRDNAPDLRALENRLSNLTREFTRRGDETPQRMADAIRKLNDRLDHLIVNSETRRPPLPERPDPTAAAVNEIRSRQQALDTGRAARRVDDAAKASEAPPSGPRMTDLDQHLRALTRQLETMHRPCGFEDAVAALRSDLGRIGDALAKAMPRCALDELESQVESLANRAVRDRQAADMAAFAGIEQRLGQIHESLTGLTPAENIGGFEAAVEALSRKIDVLAANGPDTAALHHLEAAIAELRHITERVASGDALATLADEVRTLAERMDRFAEPDSRDALASLERRIDSLNDVINARVNEPEHRHAFASIERRIDKLNELINARAAEAEVPSRVEAMIGALSMQLQRLDLGESNRAALHHIEAQIAQLGEKIDTSEARFGHVEVIERGLTDLFHQIEDIRANIGEASAFKRDLADLRLTQAEADRRTQEMLGAVQDTIDRLADRLTTIETEQRAERARPHAPMPVAVPVAPRTPMTAPLAAAPLPAAPLAPAPQATAPPAAAPRPPAAEGPVLAPPPSPPVRPAIDPTLPANHPLEPGSIVPRGRPATAAERIAASQAVLAPLKSTNGAGAPGVLGAPETNEKANFIAAARRAAQAAAAEAGQPKRADDKPAAPVADEADDGGGKFKRPLLLSVAAAILVIGATHVTLTMLGSSGSPTVETPAHADATPARKLPIPPIDAAAKPAGAPVPNSQLLAPTSVSNLFGPAPAPRQDAAPAANNAAAANAAAGNAAAGNATVANAGDITGSLPKQGDPPAAAPPADSLPAAIGGPGLRAAALAGNAAAEYEIALRYSEGRGIAQNFIEAAQWFERAANRGLAPAQYRLGSLYEKGHGVKKDLDAARRLYLAAAERGNARAMHNLAVLYAEGIDGKPEYKTAYQWFRKAASHGIADSQYNLGILNARGIGTEQNLAESYKWFALAAQQGDQDAGRKRDDLAQRLDPQSLVAAKLAAQTFTVEPQPEEATTVKVPAGGWDQPASAAAAPAPAPPPAKPKAATPKRI